MIPYVRERARASILVFANKDHFWLQLPTEGLPTPFYQWLSNRQEVSSLLQRTTLEEVPAGITSMPLTATSSPNIGLSSHSALPAGYGAENEHLPISRSDNTLEVPKGK
jgi:hypothetical protein